MYLKQNPKLTGTAKTLRRNMTPEENHLWYDFLRHFPIHIYKQRPIGNYIADFYCSDAHLVIEIDGSQHYNQSDREYDERRTEYLNSLGIEVIRFTNFNINNDFNGVCYMINSKIQDRLKN